MLVQSSVQQGCLEAFLTCFQEDQKLKKKPFFSVSWRKAGGLLLAKVASLLALFVSVLSKSFFQTFFQSYRKPFESPFFSANPNFQTAVQRGEYQHNTSLGHVSTS